MKLSAFEKIIRKVVREEIDYALRREIALLKEEITESPKTTIHEDIKEPLSEMYKEKLRQQIAPSFNTGNDTLNELLTETATTPSFEERAAANDPINQFLTKDYSQLMEAIDKKKNFRPGT